MEPLSDPDTNGAEESVIVSEASSFQRLKCMQEWYLGWEKVSCLERCPQFRSVLIEREGEREVPLYILYVFFSDTHTHTHSYVMNAWHWTLTMMALDVTI